MIFPFECSRNTSTIALSAILFAAVPVLWSQTSRSLEWHLEQQPTSVPCTSEDIAFASAPEQIRLRKSYYPPPNPLPDFPEWKCESIKAPAFYDTRVLMFSLPSAIDDGLAYTMIQPHGSTNARLLPFSEGGQLSWGNEGDRHNLAAMNAILQTAKIGQPEAIDWLALSLAYLTLLGEAPTLADTHYSPGPTEHFSSYTVPGLLSELPALTKKHLLPTLNCDESLCTVHFFYRTEPVEPLKVADFKFLLQDGTVRLLQVKVQDYLAEGNKKRASD